MDVHDKQTRSYNMSQIKSKNTKPEEMVCKYLFSHGFRYRKNDKRYPGKPDIVLPKYKTIIFINGCFWHKHDGCKYYSVPKTNTEFWLNKINRNAERDSENFKKLTEMGWNVIIVWTCELKNNRKDERLDTLVLEIEKQRNIKYQAKGLL